MWKLQGGSYIPGFSGQAFGAGLQRDVTKTRKDQAKKARALQKYMSKRGSLGKWGGMLAGAAAGALLTPVLGPGGVMVGKALASGLGSAAGSSKFLSGEGPSMKPGVGTGLLGYTYEQLGEAKGGIDESMRGQAYGAGAASLASGLTGMAGDKLLNKAVPIPKIEPPTTEPLTELGTAGLSGEKGIFSELSPELQERYMNWASTPGRVSNRTIGDWYSSPEFMSSSTMKQQGGYMQGYQEGGMMPGGVSNALPYQQGGEIERKTLYDVGRDKDEGIVDYDDDFYNYKRILSIPADQVGEGEGLRYYDGEGISDRLQSSKDQAGFDARQKMAFAPQDSIPFDMIRDYLKPERKGLMKMLGFQQGGSISPYNLGGSVTQQPMAYQLGGLLKYKRSPTMG